MLVLTVWGKSRKALLIGVLCGVVISTLEMAILYHPYTDPSRVYYGTDTRVAALLLGSALAFVWAPWRLVGRTGRNAGIVLDVVAAGSGLRPLLHVPQRRGVRSRALYRGGFLPSRVVSTILIAATVHPASKFVPWLLGFAVFRWIGVRSYGIYLWHWPIYMVTRPHSDVPFTGIPLLVFRLDAHVRRGRALVQVRRGTDPPRRDRTPVGAVPHRRRPRSQRKLMTRFAARRRRDRRRVCVIIVIGLGNGGSAAAPAALAGPTQVVRRSRRVDHHRRRPGHDAHHGAQRDAPPRAPGDAVASGGHRHRRLGDARRRQPADRHHRHDVRHRHGPAGDHRRRGREPPVLHRASTTSSPQGHGRRSARSSSCSSAPTAPSTPASSTA